MEYGIKLTIQTMSHHSLRLSRQLGFELRFWRKRYQSLPLSQRRVAMVMKQILIAKLSIMCPIWQQYLRKSLQNQ